MAFSTIRIRNSQKSKHGEYLCFSGLFEGAIGFVDLVISGLLSLGQLESLEVVEGSSRPASDDALVEGIFLPLFVDFGGGPGFADGASAGAVSDADLVLHQTHVFELHRLMGNTRSIDECGLLVDDIHDGDETMLEGPDADVGHATDLHEVVENAHSHFDIERVLKRGCNYV